MWQHWHRKCDIFLFQSVSYIWQSWSIQWIFITYGTQSILLYFESKVLQSGLREKVTLLKPILAHFLLAWKILRSFFMNATFYLIFGCWWKQVFEPITAFPTFHRQQNNSFQKAFLRNSFSLFFSEDSSHSPVDKAWKVSGNFFLEIRSKRKRSRLSTDFPYTNLTGLL